MTLRIGFCLLAIWVVFIVIVGETRRNAWSNAAAFEAGVAALAETAIAREIEFYDLSIRAAAVNSIDDTILALPPRLRRLAIFDESAGASGLGRIMVLDRNGRVVVASRDDVATGLDLSDRNYFKKQKADPSAGLYVDGPFVGRVTRVPSIGISRRRVASDGSFDGVVVGTIKLSFFEDLFASIRLPHGSSITLVRRDGTILASVPGGRDSLGQQVVTESLAASMARGAGTARQVAATDGVDRLFALRRVGDLPIFVTVGLATSQILAAWRLETLVVGAGFSALTALIVMLGLNLGGELRRRGEAERSLAELASTDYLTRIANRRRFDAALAGEWQRCARAGSPLSLLMADADFFKSFNDTYGHLRGDHVLRMVAAALTRCVERPGDLVARFGGEEFAVLLPATGSDGALAVAGAIRAAIDALDLDHAASPAGRLTVSIGVATSIPDAALAPETLVAAADAALYDAKNAGRDRIVCADRALPHALDERRVA